MTRALAVLLALGVLPGVGVAQLLSPGPLSSPHEDLQGIRQCTSCHQLGQRGTAAERCLSCHEALAGRLSDGRGWHASVASKPCGSCHAEHYGSDFALIRLDTASFDHGAAGYRLRDAHARVACRDCHTSEHVRDPAVRAEKQRPELLARTFLGLTQTCATCHADENAHERQFERRDCAVCHTETEWTEALAFDHAKARYTLTGRHRSVECASCHALRGDAVQYRGIQHAQCTSCHTDPHRGGQGAACATCHTTDGWRSFGAGFDPNRFDHASTQFPLRAAHARIDCGACHRSPARSDAHIRVTFARGSQGGHFPAPVVKGCGSCHVAAHPGARPGAGAGANCAACHDEGAWSPAAFGMREHAATRFSLDGAHVLLACSRCHGEARGGRLDFRADLQCSGCHEADSPHGRAYADARGATECTRCHVTRSWQPSAVEHTAFPLTDRHAAVACAQCHTPERRETPRTCEGCHAVTDPHRGQSAGRTCEACHDTRGFRVAAAFDHSSTSYTLEGAHVGIACRSCHVSERSEPGSLVLRYTPLPTRCEDCHAE